jgi:hypothetical protein
MQLSNQQQGGTFTLWVNPQPCPHNGVTGPMRWPSIKLAQFSKDGSSEDKGNSNPTYVRRLTESLHIRAGYFDPQAILFNM